MDDRAGWRGQQRDRPRQEREGPLALRVEGAFGLEAALQLLQAGTQLAHIVELDLVDIEAEPPGLVVEIDPAAEDEHLPVLGQRRHPAGVVGEKDGLDLAEPVLDREVEDPGGAALHPGDLALEQDGRKRPQLALDLLGELGHGERARRFFGPNHRG